MEFLSASTSVLPMNTQDCSPLGWTGCISFQSMGLSRVFFNTTVQKHQFFGAQLSLKSNSQHLNMTTGKTIALTRWTFVDKIMSLLFNMLSRLVITFLPRSKIMASGPITSWEMDGETVETVSDFIFGGSKITVGGDCSHEIKRHLLLGRKVMTNLDSILKSRDIILSTKVHLVKAMVFPVVMLRC